jgi:trk system potassium uptake protein
VTPVHKTARLLAVSFATTILLGACVLYLLGCLAPGETAKTAVEVLFTSTSAVCVTGLIVRDTGSEFGLFSQAVILLLIQLGGLGILSFSNLVVVSQTGRLSVEQRLVVEQTHGALPHVGATEVLKAVFLYTFVVETIGAVILSIRFALDYPLGYAVWLGVFHAVSAYCNAGFSLFSTNLTAYRNDWVVNLTVMTLIVTGGMGMIVLVDLVNWTRRRRRRAAPRLALHTRVVLRTTLLLIIGGAALVFLLELTGNAIRGPWTERLLGSVFLSITSRTAGFNTVDTSSLTNGALLLVMILMTVGGGAGSTAGGIKTSTAAVLYALIRSRARNRPKVEMLDRSVPMDVVAKALTTTAGFLGMIVFATLLLQVTELYGAPHNLHRGAFLEHLFEVVSALGTVGLSTGLTAALSDAGKLVIILCMFVGRLGPLLIAGSLIGLQRRIDYSYPEEHIIVG